MIAELSQWNDELCPKQLCKSISNNLTAKKVKTKHRFTWGKNSVPLSQAPEYSSVLSTTEHEVEEMKVPRSYLQCLLLKYSYLKKRILIMFPLNFESSFIQGRFYKNVQTAEAS